MSLMLPLAWLVKKEDGRVLASSRDVGIFLPLWVTLMQLIVPGTMLESRNPEGSVQTRPDPPFLRALD